MRCRTSNHRIQVGEIQHIPEAVDAWPMELSQRYQERPIAITPEQVRGSLVFMLTKYKHLVIFPIHPARLASYRKSFRPSGVKGDPHDAGLLLDLLTRHREKFRRIAPDTAETRPLRLLVDLASFLRKLFTDTLRCLTTTHDLCRWNNLCPNRKTGTLLKSVVPISCY